MVHAPKKSVHAVVLVTIAPQYAVASRWIAACCAEPNARMSSVAGSESRRSVYSVATAAVPRLTPVNVDIVSFILEKLRTPSAGSGTSAAGTGGADGATDSARPILLPSA